jgi:hypothetical protein
MHSGRVVPYAETGKSGVAEIAPALSPRVYLRCPETPASILGGKQVYRKLVLERSTSGGKFSVCPLYSRLSETALISPNRMRMVVSQSVIFELIRI